MGLLSKSRGGRSALRAGLGSLGIGLRRSSRLPPPVHPATGPAAAGRPGSPWSAERTGSSPKHPGRALDRDNLALPPAPPALVRAHQTASVESAPPAAVPRATPAAVRIPAVSTPRSSKSAAAVSPPPKTNCRPPPRRVSGEPPALATPPARTCPDASLWCPGKDQTRSRPAVPGVWNCAHDACGSPRRMPSPPPDRQ